MNVKIYILSTTFSSSDMSNKHKSAYQSYCQNEHYACKQQHSNLIRTRAGLALFVWRRKRKAPTCQ